MTELHWTMASGWNRAEAAGRDWLAHRRHENTAITVTGTVVS